MIDIAMKPPTQTTDDTISSPLGKGLNFERLEVLESEKHGGLAIDDAADFKFAAGTHIIPLNAVEFSAACRHYPILFNSQAELMTVALVGIVRDENLFIESAGGWTPGCYVPAFIRRYPFVLTRAEGGDSEEFKLCIDAGSDHVTDTGFGEPLFEGGRPGEIVRRMASFAAAFAKEQGRTRQFVAACRDADILVDRAVRMPLADGQNAELRGFQVIDEDRLRALPDKDLKRWWRNGWSAMAFAHLISLGNFGRLIHKKQGSGAGAFADTSWLT